MKQIDWEMLADNIFIILLTSPIWVVAGTGIYSIFNLLIRGI